MHSFCCALCHSSSNPAVGGGKSIKAPPAHEFAGFCWFRILHVQLLFQIPPVVPGEAGDQSGLGWLDLR